MFRLALLLSLTSFALGLGPSDIKVSLKAVKSSVESIDDIALSAIITNPTNKDIRLFAKNNLLDPSSTRSFDVSKNGSDVQFTGIVAFFDLSSDAVYTTIPANSSVTVNHTGLAPLYDFEKHGTGEFTFTPNPVFQTDPDSDPVELEINPVKVNVTSDVDKRELISLEARKSTPTCSNAQRLSVLKNARSGSITMAKETVAYLKSHPSSDLFKKFFKGNKHADIQHRFELIADDHGNRKIHCTGDPAKLCGANSGVVAYTNLALSGGQIVQSDVSMVCNIFFTKIPSNKELCTKPVSSRRLQRS